MMRYLPLAASKPPIRALPYPFFSTWTTRAPVRRAISTEPSVEPLSATTTSPEMLEPAKKVSALRMHVSSVSASFKQGITTETSISEGGWVTSTSGTTGPSIWLSMAGYPFPGCRQLDLIDRLLLPPTDASRQASGRQQKHERHDGN